PEGWKEEWEPRVSTLLEGLGPDEPAGEPAGEPANKMPFAVREHVTSEMFSEFAMTDDGHEAPFGVRLVFAKHRLVLRPAPGDAIKGIDVEVRLSSYGSHTVRMAYATPRGAPWTGHDVDQWIRRGGPDVGEETISFEPDDGSCGQTWD